MWMSCRVKCGRCKVTGVHLSRSDLSGFMTPADGDCILTSVSRSEEGRRVPGRKVRRVSRTLDKSRRLLGRPQEMVATKPVVFSNWSKSVQTSRTREYRHVDSSLRLSKSIGEGERKDWSGRYLYSSRGPKTTSLYPQTLPNSFSHSPSTSTRIVILVLPQRKLSTFVLTATMKTTDGDSFLRSRHTPNTVLVPLSVTREGRRTTGERLI